jgi:hypothetical protein
MGYNLYFYLDSKGYNYSFLKNSSFLELLIIFNMFYFIINKFIYLFINLLLSCYLCIDISDVSNLDIDLNNYMGDNNNGSSNTSSSNTSNTTSSSNSGSYQGGDTYIMTTALAGGYALAKKMPSTGGKILAVTGSAGVGMLAIAGKNISKNISSDIGRHNIINHNLNISNLNMSEIFDLSGNNGLDMLLIIQYFQKFSIIFLLLLIYQLFLKSIPADVLVQKLEALLPYKLLYFIKKHIIKIQKLSNILIIIFTLLLLISNILAYYYLEFYIDNLDKIIEIYFKK